MQSSAWVSLLRHIPAEQHSQYMLVTVSGTEIAIQMLLRIEAECVVLKGRLSGSQDAGRVFFVPYAHIDYFGTQQPVKESDFHETFGSLVLPDGPEPETVPGPGEQPQAPGAPGRGSGPRPLIRSEVLERYRARPSSAAILPPARSGSS